MLKSNYEFEVIVHGSAAKEYYHRGSHYIEGKEGSTFSIRMRNNSSTRCLFVPTIDGLSVMNGKEASFKSRGYIVNAYSSETISGWRTSDDKVSEFFFSTPKQSYAKRMGKGGNLGVIGCAIFKEQYKEPEVIIKTVHIHHDHHGSGCQCPKCCPWLNGPQWSTYKTSTKSSLSMQASTSAINIASLASSGTSNMYRAEAGLGTGFGQDKYSPVISVDFDKESSPVETFNIFYNTRERLAEMGIEFKKPLYVTRSPSAFPNENGYCERP